MQGATMEGKTFTMPSDAPGPRCIKCQTPLKSVYRTTHKDRYTFREHICPRCGKKNTTMQRTIERID